MLIQYRTHFTEIFAEVCVNGGALTLGSTLCPVWLTEREETVSAKTLVASLCVLALLRTRAVHLTLVHVCEQN